MKTILEIIKPALLDEAGQHLYTLESRDPQYQQWKEKYSACWERLRKVLPKEQYKDLMELEDLRNYEINLENEELYMCGMRDTIALLKMLQVL